VPEGLSLAPGDAVEVPFGPRRVPGLVVAAGDRPAYGGELRTVERRLGELPLVPPDRVELARWIASYYLSPLTAAVALVLPRAVHAVDDLVPPDSAGVVGLRLELEPEAALRALARLPAATAGRALPAVVALLDAGGSLSVRALRREHGLTAATEQHLLDAGIVCACNVAVRPAPATSVCGEAAQLTDEQQAAHDAIAAAMAARFAGRDAASTFLLHGVTGSGKTEVYLAVLEAARRHGRRGIVLVPEIALTPQTVARFEARFGERVAVIHGRLARGRHREQWFGARSGRFDVVVGARSALFAPLPDLGLIVVDEEHEPSYKQSSPAPRYHAREAAARLARLTGAVLVLGSATPDVASARRAEAGDYRLLRLTRRVAPGAAGSADDLPLPELAVVDMARELREGNQGVLSRRLDTSLAEALAAGEQALLFLNRRGSASLLLCRECGNAPHCPRCSVAYALHAVEGRLICHQCHHSRGVPRHCPKCGSPRFRPVGIGTQRLEALVRERFPDARVLRWDGDTAGSQARHAEMTRLVAGREVDVVVGTQMVAKGHDFAGVTLVGVVNADLSLNIPDFRAAERTFQLLVQVAGRAGRRDRRGQVVVQTYAPEHYAVRAAAEGDYAAFYEREIGFRRRLGYPPFAALTRLVLSHEKEGPAEQEAKRYAELLRVTRARLGLPGPQIVGPAPCFLSRIKGRWRWQILLKGRAARELLAEVPPPQRWAVDVDPVDVL
jgi:primosomal protein N' (replication factor Y)